MDKINQRTMQLTVALSLMYNILFPGKVGFSGKKDLKKQQQKHSHDETINEIEKQDISEDDVDAISNLSSTGNTITSNAPLTTETATTETFKIREELLPDNCKGFRFVTSDYKEDEGGSNDTCMSIVLDNHLDLMLVLQNALLTANQEDANDKLISILEDMLILTKYAKGHPFAILQEYQTSISAAIEKGELGKEIKDYAVDLIFKGALQKDVLMAQFAPLFAYLEESKKEEIAKEEALKKRGIGYGDKGIADDNNKDNNDANSQESDRTKRDESKSGAQEHKPRVYLHTQETLMQAQQIASESIAQAADLLIEASNGDSKKRLKATIDAASHIKAAIKAVQNKMDKSHDEANNIVGMLVSKMIADAVIERSNKFIENKDNDIVQEVVKCNQEKPVIDWLQSEVTEQLTDCDVESNTVYKENTDLSVKDNCSDIGRDDVENKDLQPWLPLDDYNVNWWNIIAANFLNSGMNLVLNSRAAQDALIAQRNIATSYNTNDTQYMNAPFIATGMVMAGYLYKWLAKKNNGNQQVIDYAKKHRSNYQTVVEQIARNGVVNKEFSSRVTFLPVLEDIHRQEINREECFFTAHVMREAIREFEQAERAGLEVGLEKSILRGVEQVAREELSKEEIDACSTLESAQIQERNKLEFEGFLKSEQMAIEKLYAEQQRESSAIERKECLGKTVLQEEAVRGAICNSEETAYNKLQQPVLEGLEKVSRTMISEEENKCFEKLTDESVRERQSLQEQQERDKLLQKEAVSRLEMEEGLTRNITAAVAQQEQSTIEKREQLERALLQEEGMRKEVSNLEDKEFENIASKKAQEHLDLQLKDFYEAQNNARENLYGAQKNEFAQLHQKIIKTLRQEAERSKLSQQEQQDRSQLSQNEFAARQGIGKESMHNLTVIEKQQQELQFIMKDLGLQVDKIKKFKKDNSLKKPKQQKQFSFGLTEEDIDVSNKKRALESDKAITARDLTTKKHKRAGFADYAKELIATETSERDMILQQEKGEIIGIVNGCAQEMQKIIQQQQQRLAESCAKLHKDENGKRKDIQKTEGKRRAYLQKTMLQEQNNLKAAMAQQRAQDRLRQQAEKRKREERESGVKKEAELLSQKTAPISSGMQRSSVKRVKKEQNLCFAPQFEFKATTSQSIQSSFEQPQMQTSGIFKQFNAVNEPAFTMGTAPVQQKNPGRKRSEVYNPWTLRHPCTIGVEGAFVF